MSSDDYLEVRETKNHEYDVTHKSTAGGIIEKIGHFKNLRHAMIAADEYDRKQDFNVEYGIQFVPWQSK